MQNKPQTQQQDLPVLEFDHLIGYEGKTSSSAHFHPIDPNYIIYPIGGLIVIENINDKHDQLLLRGHDMPISSVAISPSGTYIASGQQGSIYTKTKESPVILWNYKKKRAENVFKGIREGITNLSFSHDEKFIAATGANNTFIIWNSQDYSLVHSKVLEQPINLITWSAPRKSASKHSTYVIITAQSSTLLINVLDFNVGSMQYTLKQTSCQLPSTGLIRTYTQASIDQEGSYIFVGTLAGEVCIFNIPNQVFKAAIPISNNGVLSVCLIDNLLFLGSGDGRLKKLKGTETKWSLESEVQLEGQVQSLSVSQDKKELLVGTSQNKIYRVLTNTMDALLYIEGHAASITSLAFLKTRNDIFATIDTLGYIYVWDNNDFNIITKCTPGTMNKVHGTTVTIAEDNTVIGGFDDGFIRCFAISNKKFSPVKWEIVNAHKGSVCSLYADENYVLSGGQDGIVRVWSRSNRQLIKQIAIHTKDVVSVFPDIQKPNIIHSCSIDKSVHTYDLKLDKKVIFHQAKNGMILHMSQRKDHEQELVTCGLNMPIYFWDCDVNEPVEQINIPDKLNCIEVSSTGQYMAIGNDQGEIGVIEVNSKRLLGKFVGHSSAVSKLKWTPDEKQIISSSYDGSICIWNFFPN